MDKQIIDVLGIEPSSYTSRELKDILEAARGLINSGYSLDQLYLKSDFNIYTPSGLQIVCERNGVVAIA